MGAKLVATEPGAIPTIEVARVSALADAIVQQFDSYAASDPIGAAKHHAAIMAIVEPELERAALARSSIAALRATVAELQELVRHLAAPSPAVAYLRDLPLEDRQALNVQIAAGIGSGGTLIGGIAGVGDRVLEFLAERIDARQVDSFEPKNRLAA